MTAPAPPRGDLAELLGLVDVSRARAASAEQQFVADVGTLYAERDLQRRSEDEDSPLLNAALLAAVVALIRRAYRAGWDEGLRFAGQQFIALDIGPSDLAVPVGSTDDALVRDFLSGQASGAKVGVALAELRRRAVLAVVSAVQMGRAEATEAAFAQLDFPGSLHKLWVARFDLNAAPCSECARLHGVHVPLGTEFERPKGSTEPYEGSLVGPPRHPNCRCSLVLYIPELFDEDSASGPTPLSMRTYGEWVLQSSESDRRDLLAATIVRVGSYTRMVRGKLQHVDGYFYHIESGKVVSPAQARALGGGEIRTVSVQQAKAMRTQGKAPIGQAAGRATARRSRAPGPGQAALNVGAPAKQPVTAQQAPRPQPPAGAQGTARRQVARDPQKQWPQGEYEIKMPSGQNTKVTIHANGSSTATSGDRTEKANARQTKLFLDFWDGQGVVTQTKGDPTPDEKKDSEKHGRPLEDPRPDPVRDADREAPWQGDKPPAKAKPPEPEDDVAAKAEGVVQKGRASLDPEKKPDEKKSAAKKPDEKKPDEKKPEAQKPAEKKADAPAGDSGDPNSDVKEMSAQELAAEIADVEDELRDMRRSGMSVDDPDYKDVKERLRALNVEEDSRTRSDVAEPSDAGSATAGPDAKQAPQSVEKPAAKKPDAAAKKPEKVATKPEKAPEQPADKPAPEKKVPAAAKKPAAPKPAPEKVSAEDAARGPAAVPKVDKLDAASGRKMLQRAKASEKIVQVAGDDGSALASAMQLVTSTRHKHHVKVTDDSVRVSLKHIPVSNDGSRQYLVHSNGVVFERGIDASGNETLTQMPFKQVENLVEPKFSGESRLSLDDALKNVRKLTDDQLSDYMDEAIKSDRIDDFERMANESDRREGQRARTAAQREARAAEIERLLDEGFSVGEATEKVTGVSVDKQQRKMMIDHLRAEGYTGVNLEELSRRAYKNYLYDMELSSEGPTIGYLLNKEGTAKGVDPSSMFYGSDEHRERYMSDELRDFFESTEYPKSFEDWQKAYLQRAVDSEKLGRSGDGGAATKTDSTFDAAALPQAPEPKGPRAFRGRNADGTERAVEARPAPAPASEPAPDPGQVLDDARDRVASELGISSGDAEEAVAEALVDMADRGEDPYASAEALARSAVETRRASATPDAAAGSAFKPTGRWQGGRLESLSDEEIDAEKTAADQALTDAVKSGMRSSSPQMFDLKMSAKKFGEEQQKRRDAKPASTPEPVQSEVSAPAKPAPARDAQGLAREPYQDKPGAVDVKPGSEAQLREAIFLFEDGLVGDQKEDDVLGAYLSPDRKTLQVHDKQRTLATIDDMIEGVESNVGPDSRMSAEDQSLERGKAKALKQLRARVEKAQVGAKKVAAGKETKRAYADAVSENVHAKRRAAEDAARAAETPEQRDDRELAAFDTALKEMDPEHPATARVREMRDAVAARVEARTAAPVGKRPEDREDMRFARKAKDTGAAPLFMFESDDSLQAMQTRNQAVLDSGSLKPTSAEFKNRTVLAEKLASELKVRDRARADEEERRARLEQAAVVQQPERAPEKPIEEVRAQVLKARERALADDATDAEREDFEVAVEWATFGHGDPRRPGAPKLSQAELDKIDRAMSAGLVEAANQRKLAEQFEAERRARNAAKDAPPPAASLEAPASIPEEHADLLGLDDRGLSDEWQAVQQDMKDMRSDGVKTTDADYLENKARLNAIFAVMARRAQEGNREYIGGTPSRLEKLQELAKAVQQAPPGERAALEAQLIRVFRGEE